MAIAFGVAVDLNLSRKLLLRACEVAGGADRLSERLEVDRHALEFWASGRATPPEHIIFAAIDLVLEDDIARAAQDRRKNVVQRALSATVVAILPARTVPDASPPAPQAQAFPIASVTPGAQAAQDVPVRGPGA